MSLFYEPFGVKLIISDPPTGLLSAPGSSYLGHLLLQRRDILSSIGPSNLMTERSRPQ